MKTVALNHAESCRRRDVGRVRTPDSDRLDVLGSGLRDAYDGAIGSIPDGLAALARRIDAQRALAARAG